MIDKDSLREQWLNNIITACGRRLAAHEICTHMALGTGNREGWVRGTLSIVWFKEFSRPTKTVLFIVRFLAVEVLASIVSSSSSPSLALLV